MKKKYEIIVDGKKVNKNVAPEKEKAFLEKYPNAVLISDEPGKSKGARPPQNNQQIDTESKSEDGSLDSPVIEGGELEEIEVIEKGIRKKNKNFQHPTEKDFRSQIDRTTILDREERLTEWLNYKYSNVENNSIKFKQSKKGRNAIEVLIDDEKEGKVFDIDTDNKELCQDIKTHIDLSTDPELNEEVMGELLGLINIDDSFVEDKSVNKS